MKADHGLTVIVLDVLVEPEAQEQPFSEDGGQCGLADLQRLAPQVVMGSQWDRCRVYYMDQLMTHGEQPILLITLWEYLF